MIITGLTNISGKSTCLEALVSRSGMKCLIFKTKIGEEVFTEGTMLRPFFKENVDWKYVESILEATMKERMKFERAWIIKASEGCKSLFQVYQNLKSLQSKVKDGSLQHSVYTTLIAYFDEVLPQIQKANLSNTLNIENGINIMDLEELSDEVQSLVIRSVLEEIHKKENEIIVVLPESWKFLSQKRGNPAKYAAEIFVRQGAVRHNYLFIDSQDIANVEKTIVKQSGTWILGLQTERNEVMHSIDQIPLPKKSKPNPDEIMTLDIGQFIVCTPRFTAKVFVQPSWMDYDTAQKIAKGEIKELPKRPTESNTFRNFIKPQIKEKTATNDERYDMLEKNIHQLSDQVYRLNNEVLGWKRHSKDQKIEIDEKKIIESVLSLMPKGQNVTYKVEPVEALKKEFLLDAKNKIISDISNLSEKAKHMMKYLESRGGMGIPVAEICIKGFLMKDGAGSNNKQVVSWGKELTDLHFARRQTNGRFEPQLLNQIKELVEVHGASETEMKQLYDHIIYELLQPQTKESILA